MFQLRPRMWYEVKSFEATKFVSSLGSKASMDCQWDSFHKGVALSGTQLAEIAEQNETWRVLQGNIRYSNSEMTLPLPLKIYWPELLIGTLSPSGTTHKDPGTALVGDRRK